MVKGTVQIKPTEKQIRGSIVDLLRRCGWFVFFLQQGLGAFKGLPDLIAIHNGRVVFIEVKTPHGTQSHHQKAFERRWKEHGGEYFLLRSPEEVAQQLGLRVLL